MNSDASQTRRIQAVVNRLIAGDVSARDELINCSWERLLRLTRNMLRGFPNVRRWEQTEDVFQKASLRLWKALENVELQDARHFLRLAAEKIRFELIDLARHYQGPLGHGSNHASQAGINSEGNRTVFPRDLKANAIDPSSAAQWADIHRQIERLPDTEREVFDLLWYHDLTQEEAAKILKVDVRTVKRRWRQARLFLQKKLTDEPETAHA